MKYEILLCTVYTFHPFTLTLDLTYSCFHFPDYGTTDKAKSISLKVLNKDNCREVTDRKEEERTKTKEGRTEQVLEVKRSTMGSLYPDLALLTDG